MPFSIAILIVRGTILLFLVDQPRGSAPAVAREPGLLNRLTAWLLRVVPSSSVYADEEPGGWCTCSQESDWCDAIFHPGGHCCDGITCDKTVFYVMGEPEDARYYPYGCGTGNWYECNGKCTG